MIASLPMTWTLTAAGTGRAICMAAFLTMVLCGMAGAADAASSPLAGAAAEARRLLLEKHAAGEAARIERGVAQVMKLWRAQDGDAEAFKTFVVESFIPEGEALDAAFARLEFAFERIGGYFTSMERDLRRGTDLDIGPMLSIDPLLASFSPRAHLIDDLFSNKIAFVVLLNFPLTTLDQRLAAGMTWSRRAWAETRLAGSFSVRIPADVNQRITAAFAEADTYISTYNIWMHHLLASDGSRPFPAGLRLITHWGLRDELKARYVDPEGLPRQRMIQTVMDRIVRQQIPAAVIDNPLLDWTPSTNALLVSKVEDAVPPPQGKSAVPDSAREDDERYRHWRGIYLAVREADPYDPVAPTFPDRRFQRDREIPERDVEALFTSLLDSPLGGRVARLIARRLSRPLEPFDIWYVGFRPRGRYTEEELDALTRKRYPTAEAYAADIPRLLTDLGFDAAQARFLAERIEVEPSRGAGHAFGAARPDDKAHLRTRVGAQGMDYKGYNIAVHEMGHNVEQVFSLSKIDHTLLQGVPNTAFTEALAFVFQSRDLALLGLAGPDENAAALRALETFWNAREIAGVGLVDMKAWRWLYAHPDATPAQFRQAVVTIAEETWNRWYAPLLGKRDVALLAVYSHMIDAGLYTPDYPLGHLIAFQIEEHFRKHQPIGAEFERICRLGSITPDAWMRQAVGSPLSEKPLLNATGRALDAMEQAGD